MITNKQRKALVLGCLAIAAAGCRDVPRATAGDTPTPAVAAAPAVPVDVLPANRVLDPQRFTDRRTRAAYTAAKQYATVLEKIYCYCRCKENIGHRALVECFETDHAEHCDACQMEAVVAARMSAEGKTPAEIQKAIDAYFAS